MFAHNMHLWEINTDRCYLQMSPDAAYLIDYLGSNKNIVLCSMLSGTGFKVSIIVKLIVSIASL